VEDARTAHDRARQELTDLEQRLEDARSAAAAAQQHLDQATDRETQARHTVDQASKDARRADQQLRRLR
jgi:predicted  nucleic acid-binding Zn-ribbon protein